MGDEVTSVTGEGKIFDAAARTASDFDHFPDVGKMAPDLFIGGLAGDFGLFNSVQEIVPFGIAKNGLKFAGAPAFRVFDEIAGVFNFLKRSRMKLFSHLEG